LPARISLTAMPDATIAYSTAVAAASSRANCRASLPIVIGATLNMAYCLLVLGLRLL